MSGRSWFYSMLLCSSLCLLVAAMTDSSGWQTIALWSALAIFVLSVGLLPWFHRIQARSAAPDRHHGLDLPAIPLSWPDKTAAQASEWLREFGATLESATRPERHGGRIEMQGSYNGRDCGFSLRPTDGGWALAIRLEVPRTLHLAMEPRGPEYSAIQNASPQELFETGVGELDARYTFASRHPDLARAVAQRGRMTQLLTELFVVPQQHVIINNGVLHARLQAAELVRLVEPQALSRQLSRFYSLAESLIQVQLISAAPQREQLLTSVKCPFCMSPLGSAAKAGAPTLVVCSGCETPHHQECWGEHQGCAVFGCSVQGHRWRLLDIPSKV